MKTLLLAALSLLLALPGCASDEPSRRGTVTIVEPDHVEPDDFVITRAEYEAAIERGPSWLIRQVTVQPVVSSGRFLGFMVVSLFDDSDRYALKIGDVVQRVNGHRIERPDQFMKAWKTLAGADQLQVQVIRERQPLVLTWEIR